MGRLDWLLSAYETKLNHSPHNGNEKTIFPSSGEALLTNLVSQDLSSLQKQHEELKDTLKKALRDLESLKKHLITDSSLKQSSTAKNLEKEQLPSQSPTNQPPATSPSSKSGESFFSHIKRWFFEE